MNAVSQFERTKNAFTRIEWLKAYRIARLCRHDYVATIAGGIKLANKTDRVLVEHFAQKFSVDQMRIAIHIAKI